MQTNLFCLTFESKEIKFTDNFTCFFLLSVITVSLIWLIMLKLYLFSSDRHRALKYLQLSRNVKNKFWEKNAKQNPGIKYKTEKLHPQAFDLSKNLQFKQLMTNNYDENVFIFYFSVWLPPFIDADDFNYI